MRETIAWLFSSPMDRVSFGRVADGICSRLVKDYDVVCLSGDYKGMPSEYKGINIFQLQNVKTLSNALEKINPDITIILGPSLFFKSYHKPYKQFNKSKQIAYVIVDLPPIDYYKDWLSGFDLIMTPSEYSRGFLTEQGLDAKVVPHGVDLDLFKPEPKPDDIFRFGCVGANMTRKNIPSLLYSASELKKISDKPFKTMLFTDPTGAYPLIDIANHLKLTYVGDDRDIAFPDDSMRDMGLPTKQMPSIYNQFHVHVLPTSGESFGIPYIEAAACGVPTITTDMGAGMEILKDSGVYVPTHEGLIVAEGIMNVVSKRALTLAMKELLDNDDLRKDLSNKAIKIAQEYSWDKVYEIFRRELESVL